MKNQETIVFKDPEKFKAYLRDTDTMPAAYNREVKDSHCIKMKNSIEQIKVQRAINVIETDVFGGGVKRYVADGQHLRKSILTTESDKLGEHLVVFLSKTDDLGEIIPFISKMNSTAKNWTTDDYLNSWTTHGLENYEFITRKKKETKISASTLAFEIYGISSSGSKTIVGLFKNGELEINIAVGNSIINTYNDALTLGLSKNSGSLVATARLLKAYPTRAADFLNMIKKNKKTFQHKLNRDAYVTLFKNFLNITTKSNKVKIK